MLYQLLTGRLPFKATNNFSMVYQIINVDPPPPSMHRPDIPAAVDVIAGRILDMGDVLSLVEQVERDVDQDKAQKLAEKVAKGKKFDLNDMKDQLEQMQNMGGLHGLMDKLPGMGQVPDTVKNQLTGKEVPRLIAIINSMTRKERRNPALLNGSRRARIARGAGLTPADVNKLMKQYQQMEKMMSKLSAGGMKGLMRGMKGMMGGAGRGGMPFR